MMEKNEEYAVALKTLDSILRTPEKLLPIGEEAHVATDALASQMDMFAKEHESEPKTP